MGDVNLNEAEDPLALLQEEEPEEEKEEEDVDQEELLGVAAGLHVRELPDAPRG